MANLIKDLTDRIEGYRADTKTPCKNYATEAAAERATAKMAQAAANYFSKDGKGTTSANYVVFYVKPWGRWVGCIDMSELVNRPDSTGGYMGYCTGFFTY